MSGHSKWSQIKHKKGASDQKRGQLFGKLSKKISLAAKGNPNTNTNAKLQAMIAEAKSFNMPKDNIERAVRKAEDKDIANLKNVTIQAIGQASIALVIEAITDNSNRTINEVKNILTKNDARMVPEGSLNWMFDQEKNPLSPLDIANQIILAKMDKLFNELDENEDVENVYTNLRND